MAEEIGLGTRAEPKFFVVWSSGILSLSSALANFVVFDGYPLATLELAIVVAGLGLISAFVSLIYVNLRPGLQIVFDGILVGLVADLTTEGWAAPLVLTAAALAASVALRGRFIGFIAVFSSFLLGSSLLGIGDSEPWIKSEEVSNLGAINSNSSAPTIVHVLLDEHLGFSGFPNDASGRRATQDLQAFYTSRGFTTFGGAYGRHMSTINAVPDTFNLGEPVEKWSGYEDSNISIQKLRYFQALDVKGYKINIFQSNYINYCDNNTFYRCQTYKYASLMPIFNSDLPSLDKAALIGVNFATFSEVIIEFSKGYSFFSAVMKFQFDLMLPQSVLKKGATSSLSAYQAAKMFEGDLVHAEPGEAFFFHALIPHFPYSFSEECDVKNWRDWMWLRDSVSIEIRRAAYYDQARCSAQIVDGFLDALAKSPSKNNFVVIVHSDHGSRLLSQPTKSYSRRINRDDLIAGYSTLFAIRLPTAEPQKISGAFPVSLILRSLVENDFEAVQPSPAKDPKVWLSDDNWLPTKQIRFPEGF